MIKKTLSGELVAEFGLCKDRHEYPVDDCIYPETVQRMNFARLELTATSVLKPLVDQGIKSVVIYASGCTEAILATYSAALKLRVNNFTVMHYDPVYENYAALKNVYEIINEKFDKVSRYLEKNDSTMSDYYDYLKNLKELHITINKKSAFPDNFWKAHDEVVVEYAKEKAKLKDIQNKEKEIKYKEIKEKSIYQPLIINDLLIRLPESLEEIKIEGILQNNCVNSYVNRILDKQTNVLFGRKVSRPDIPYITIEIKDNRVLQARYKGNINCTAEDTKTIESYIASIKTPDKKNQAA